MMFIFEDKNGLTTNSENLTLQMEHDHPGILKALNEYIQENFDTVVPSDFRRGDTIKVSGFKFNNETYICNACYYDSYLEGRQLWNYYEDYDRLWWEYDPETMKDGQIMADVPMQVEATSAGDTYGYRATWTGHSWVFDDFDPADTPVVVRFRKW